MGKCDPHIAANGVVSMVVLCCGIAFSALLGCLLKLAVEDVVKDEGLLINSSELDSSIASTTAPLWAFGFAFIVPGIIGAISTCARVKGLYITHMVFCIITLIVMGVFFLISLLSLGILASANPDVNCYDVNNKCHCSHMDMSDFKNTCADSRKMYAMGVSLMVIIVLGWILTLVNSILSGILACRHETTPGVILRTQPTTTVVQLAPVAGMPNQVAYMPPQVGYPVPTHDQAQLVHNIEY